jgi:hypothetical protein
MEIMDKVQQLKQEALQQPKTKSKKCSSCKKKPIVNKLPEIQELSLLTNEEIELAYANLTSYAGVREQDKDNIQFVYTTLFGEPLDFNCNSCVSTQVRKFTNYMKEHKLRM